MTDPTTVVHVRDGCDVFIGRPSKWGNPYKIGRDGTRDEVVEKYRDYIMASPLRDHVAELRGKRLGCYCHPATCHGDVLAALAEESL